MPYVARATETNENLPIRVNVNGEVYVTNDDLEALVADQLLDYGLFGSDLSSDPIYTVHEDKNGNWFAFRFNMTTGASGYAALSNNPTMTTAALAWASVAALNYAARSAVAIP